MKSRIINSGNPLPGWIILLILIIFSCQKGDEKQSNYDYLIDYESISIFSQASIQVLLAGLALEYPEAASLTNNTSYSVGVYSITYTTQYKDSVIAASGLVCVPLAEEAFPVISFQNATTTLHENAPSADPFDLDYLLIEGLAGNGYIVFMPDYIGFGASKDILHPYYNKECTDQAVIDMIKAGNELLSIEEILASNNGTYYLMGYSQGGGATLSVLDAIENGPDPGFDVTAASCGAGAFNLYTMSEYITEQDTIPSALYLPYFVYSQKVYGTIQDDLDMFFNEPYASRIPLLFDGTNSSGEINDQLTDAVEDLFTAELIAGFSDSEAFAGFRNALNNNSIDAWNAFAYINFYHGSDDEHVPYSQSSDMYDDFIASGMSAEKVRLYEMEGLTHNTGIIPWGVSTFLWFNELQDK